MEMDLSYGVVSPSLSLGTLGSAVNVKITFYKTGDFYIICTTISLPFVGDVGVRGRYIDDVPTVKSYVF